MLLCQLPLSFSQQCTQEESFVDHDDYYKKNSGNHLWMKDILQRYNSRACGKYLKISNIALAKVEQNVFTAENILETLDLSNNNINHIDWNAFFHLTKLVNLDLSYNDLQRIDEHIFNKLHNLQNVNLENNQLTEIKMTFNSREQPLQTLTLSGNNLLKFECSDIRYWNGKENYPLPLKELHLSSNPNLKLSDNSFQHYTYVMTHLYLDGVSLSVYKSIQPLNLLEELSIGNDQLESFECNQLPSLPNLKYLIINGNTKNIDFSSLKKNLPKLSRVEISENLPSRSDSKILRIELTSNNVILYRIDDIEKLKTDLVKLELSLGQTNQKYENLTNTVNIFKTEQENHKTETNNEIKNINTKLENVKINIENQKSELKSQIKQDIERNKKETNEEIKKLQNQINKMEELQKNANEIKNQTEKNSGKHDQTSTFMTETIQNILILILVVSVVIILLLLVWMFFYLQWNNKPSKTTAERSQNKILNTGKNKNTTHRTLTETTQYNKIQFVEEAPVDLNPIYGSFEMHSPTFSTTPSHTETVIVDQNPLYSTITKKPLNTKQSKAYPVHDPVHERSRKPVVTLKPHLKSTGPQKGFVIPSTDNIDQNPIYQAQMKVADEDEFYSEINYL
jgi:Leucine-rich repeat (LRR) protein